MLQKFYEKDNLLTTHLEQILDFTRTLESAMDSFAATRDTSTSVNLETIQNINNSKQAKENPVYVRDTYDNDKQRRVGTCYICGDRKHYRLVCPLKKHRDLLFCAYCKNGCHVERACRYKSSDRINSWKQARTESKTCFFGQAV